MKRLITILAVGMIFTLSSCTEYLNEMPKGVKIPTTLADFSALLQDEYTVHRTTILQANNLRNDAFVTAANLAYYPLYQANYFWDENADRIALNNSDESTYYGGYAAINVCNLVIANAATATAANDADRMRVAAQAKIIRAMNYFVLANYYADTYDAATASGKKSVPLIMSADVGAAYTQVSIQEIYDFILKDVQEAIPNLAVKPATIIEPSLGAGYAFLARVYLQMERYSDALAAANQALAQNDQLFDWNAFYTANKVNIDNPTNYNRAASPMGFTFVENYYYSHGTSSNSGAESSLREDRAARYEANDLTLKTRWKLRTVGADTYYYGINSGFFNYGGLTTTEVYLIKAECLARANDLSGAMSLLNQVRAKRILASAYTPLTASTTVNAVKLINQTKENALIFSIVPFADNRRLNKDSNYARTFSKTENGKSYTLSPTSHLWTMPFPMGASKNPGNGTITQNVSK